MSQWIEKGGPLMWPLLACSILALTVAWERTWFFFRWKLRLRPNEVDAILADARSGDLRSALRRADACADPTAQMLAEGLRHLDAGLTECMQNLAARQMDQLRRGLGLLDTIITLGPLLGILGTVTGIISSFDLLGDSGVQEPRAVLAGIAVALITTAAGLTVAIIALIPYNFFNGLAQRHRRRLEEAGTQLELTQRRAAREGQHAA